MEVEFQRHREEVLAKERSGHTGLVLENLLYVWGGYMSIAGEEIFLPNDEIWTYDLEEGSWEMFHMKGEVPPSMSGTCSCCVEGTMFVFGGCDERSQSNQIYCVDLTDGNYLWRRITPVSGSAPSPRDKLSCWVYNGRIIYFGGYGFKQLSDDRNRSFIVDEGSWVTDVFWGWNNEVHVFDPRRSSWTEAQTRGRAPAPRAAHSSATLGSRGYVFGGRVMETRTNDIHCLDLETWTWTEITPATAPPVGRSWHTLTSVLDDSLFVFGGLSAECKPMSDAWLFNVETKTWREVKHRHDDKPRLWHTACPGRDSDVVVFGGSCDDILSTDKGHCNDALVFQLQPHSLFRIVQEVIARSSEPLKRHLSRLPVRLQTSLRKRLSFYENKRPET